MVSEFPKLLNFKIATCKQIQANIAADLYDNYLLFYVPTAVCIAQDTLIHAAVRGLLY